MVLVQLVLTLGILNLVLGYGLAALLADPPLGGFAPWKRWQSCKEWLSALRPRRIRPGTPALTDHDTEICPLPPDEPAWEREIAAIDEPAPRTAAEAGNYLAEPNVAAAPNIPASPPLPAVATLDELPLAWRDRMAAEQVSPRWFIDGLTQGLRVELNGYRQQVLAAEARARLVLSQESPEALEQLVADFRFLHHEWLARLLEGAELLAARRGRLGDAEEAAAGLDSLLYDQAARMDALDRRISEINFKTDFVTGCRRLLAELLELAASVHRLRDDLTNSLASILRQQQSLADLPHEQRLDALTGRQNRLGLEAARLSADSEVAEKEPEGERQAVLVAVDCFHRINERLGTRAGDRTLRAFSQLLADLLLRAGASAEMARVAGTRFLLILAGASRDQATSLAEYLRQTLEGVTFDCQGTSLELTARLGISTMEPGQSVEALLARLGAAVDAAEIAGRNRCVVADAGGSMVVAPHSVAVISRRVPIEEASDLASPGGEGVSPRKSQPPPALDFADQAQSASTSS